MNFYSVYLNLFSAKAFFNKKSSILFFNCFYYFKIVKLKVLLQIFSHNSSDFFDSIISNGAIKYSLKIGLMNVY